MYVRLGTVQKSGHIRYIRAHYNVLVYFRTIHGILSWKEFTAQLCKRKLNLQNFQQFSITFNHRNTTNFCTANFPLLNQRRTNGNLLKCNFVLFNQNYKIYNNTLTFYLLLETFLYFHHHQTIHFQLQNIIKYLTV